MARMRRRTASRISASSGFRFGRAVAKIAQQKIRNVRIVVKAADVSSPSHRSRARFAELSSAGMTTSTRSSSPRAFNSSLSSRRGRTRRVPTGQQEASPRTSKRHAQRQHQQAARQQRVNGKQRRGEARLRRNKAATAGIGHKPGQTPRAQAYGQRRAAFVVINHQHTVARARSDLLLPPPPRPGGHAVFAERRRRARRLTCSRTAARDASSMRG